MRIHIVEPYGSIAMQRMTLPLLQLSKLYEVTQSTEVDDTADINIHAPWHTMTAKGNSKHIIMYTHCNPPDVQRLYEACDMADVITCMSYTGRNELIQMGVDPKKLWVIYAAADEFKFKRKVIGIVGAVQPNARKRESLLIDLAWSNDLSPFQFLFVGNGWEETVAVLHSLGVAADAITADANGLQSAYQMMDALLVTGYAEGGPLPILEAMAVGVPVLSPKFGYASDLLYSHYENEAELMELLNDLADQSILRHQISRSWSWADYVSEYALLIGRMTNATAELYPENAADRYGQLLKIIDEIKPRNIVEIGTWSGNNALRMIQQAARYHPIEEITYQGFDLFDDMTGEQYRREYSKRGQPFEVVLRRLEATRAHISLVKGDTKQTLYRNMIDGELEPAEFIFVDGGHSEETIKNDGDIALLALDATDNGVIVFDDYYYNSTDEGIGCNKFIHGLDGVKYKVNGLSHITITADGKQIGMIEVRKNDDLHLQMRGTAHATGTAFNDGKSPYYVSSM